MNVVKQSWAVAAICSSLAGSAVLGSAATGAENEVLKLRSRLSSALVPGGGDPDGSGRASIKIHPRERLVCFRVSFSGLERVNYAAIRVGNPANTGGGRIELELFDRGEADEPQPIAGCTDVIDRPRGLRKIYTDSHRYYVQIDASGYQHGALRGRLDPQR
jgi:hypothetical protein